MLLFIGIVLASVSSQAEGKDPQAEAKITFANQPNETWQLGSTLRFDSFETFFTHNIAKTRPFFAVAYLFDTRNAHWLSYEETMAIAPKLAPVLVPNDTSHINVSSEQLAAFLNIELPSEPGLIMLYFDSPTLLDTGGQYMMAGSNFEKADSNATKIKNKRALAHQIVTEYPQISHYRIEIPAFGIKPQR
ncbi:hypothetical protein [Shewanella sp. NIFS-20-20]|uniref:hypothetical protein n=1 Tax=Shewanella sp. NIFS-20-20 TaxID=2853806 RepID=UPI001C44EEC8|nr:hypothetical protein [Shewanella sp. NIFS-20-20]MBV7316014.1 hypothetical protein [Shewanella sp. NIFS-20-20]